MQVGLFKNELVSIGVRWRGGVAMVTGGGCVQTEDGKVSTVSKE